MKTALLLVTLLGLIPIASGQASKAQTPTRPLEYKGLRLGMSADAALDILTALDEKDHGQERAEEFNKCTSGGSSNGECKRVAELYFPIPSCDDWECGNYGPLTAYVNAGRVWGVQQNLAGENVGSYVLAFTKKYGSPKMERRTYRNGLGNEFHGNVWVWTRERASLEIMEICVGSLDRRGINLSDIPCLILYSDVYAPKEALPKI